MDGKHFSGQYENDSRSGPGEFFWPMGVKYSGFYINDLRNGKGVYNFSNGDEFRVSHVQGELVV